MTWHHPALAQRTIAASDRIIDELKAENARMRAALTRIDAINDNPACFSEEINDLCGRILRPHLYQQAGTK